MSIRARFSSIDGATYTKWSLHQEESRHARIAPFSLFAESLAFPTTRAWGGVTMVKRALRLDCLNHYVFLRAQKGDVLNLLDASPVMFSGYMMERSTPPEVRDSLSLSFSCWLSTISTGASRGGGSKQIFLDFECTTLLTLGGAPIHRLGGLNKAIEQDQYMSRKKRRGKREEERGTKTPVEGLEHLCRSPLNATRRSSKGEITRAHCPRSQKKSTCSTGAALPLASPLRRDTNEALPNFDL